MNRPGSSGAYFRRSAANLVARRTQPVEAHMAAQRSHHDKRGNTMKAATKTILFGKCTVDRVHHFWPVGVFANDKTARTFAVALKAAHAAGDAETAKSLDPDTKVDADGKLIGGFKMSIKIATYEPDLPTSGVDPFAD